MSLNATEEVNTLNMEQQTLQNQTGTTRDEDMTSLTNVKRGTADVTDGETQNTRRDADKRDEDTGTEDKTDLYRKQGHIEET